MNRRYLPTLSELIDRLSIAQLKEVFITEHKSEYAQEISDIMHDINLTLREKNGIVDAETLRAVIVLSQMNLHIWHNESNYRKGIKDGRKDYKIDCLAAEFKDWEISWSKKDEEV